MKYLLLIDGKIIHASEVVASNLITRGARELKLKQIETPIIYGNETRGGDGVNQIPKPRRSRKPRNGEGEIPNELDRPKRTRRDPR